MTEERKTYIVDAEIAITDATEEEALRIVDSMKAGALVEVRPLRGGVWTLKLADDASLTAEQLA